MIPRLLIAALLLASPALASRLCVPTVAAENRNIAIGAEGYLQPMMRDLEHYAAFLREEFIDPYNELPEGAVWIDGGSGLGLAALQAARERRLHAYAVNAQNFWPRYLGLAGRADPIWDSWADVIPPHREVIARIEGFDRDALNRIATALGVEHFPQSVPQEEVRALGPRIGAWMQRIADAHAATVAAGEFRPRVGLVPNLLPELPLARLYTDLYGPYFYGARRAQLVGAVYRRLEIGGTAVFIVGDSRNELGDVVESPSGVQYLHRSLETDNPGNVLYRPWRIRAPSRYVQLHAGRFTYSDDPRHTRLQTETASLLVVRRTAERSELTLPEYVEGQTLTFTGPYGFEHPTSVRYVSTRRR